MGTMMGYFAKIDEQNLVVEIISINNEVLGEPTLSFPETEGAGRAFIANTLKLKGNWKQTSYNAVFRNKYAGIGDYYNEELDVFESNSIEETEE
jgi:hypothetical protein